MENCKTEEKDCIYAPFSWCCLCCSTKVLSTEGSYHYCKNAFPWQPVVSVVPFSITVAVKKEGWGGGGTRALTFSAGDSDFPVLKPAGKTLNVSIARGLPKDTSKSARQIAFILGFMCFKHREEAI